MSVFMTVGDVIWVFGFGLIWSFWGLKVMDKTEQVHKKIKALEAMMESLSITTSQRHLMEKYFAYQHYQNMRAKLIDTSMLPHNLPVSLV
jgi:Cyclic nucleotide-binding domain